MSKAQDKNSSQVILANTIKCGLPMGILSAFSVILFSYFLSKGDIDGTVIERSISILGIWVFFEIVLGSIRKN